MREVGIFNPALIEDIPNAETYDYRKNNYYLVSETITYLCVFENIS